MRDTPIHTFYALAIAVLVQHFTGWLRRNNLERVVVIPAGAVLPEQQAMPRREPRSCPWNRRKPQRDRWLPAEISVVAGSAAKRESANPGSNRVNCVQRRKICPKHARHSALVQCFRL